MSSNNNNNHRHNRAFCILDIKQMQNKKKTSGDKSSQQRYTRRNVGGSGGSRHVRWRHKHLYHCIREGSITFQASSEIDVYYRSNALDEAYFWIFKHNDAQAQRSEETPLYEAVYNCNGDFLLVQKCHLMQAYTKAKRTDRKRMWDMLADDDSALPYWVDRYAFRKAKEKRVIKMA